VSTSGPVMVADAPLSLTLQPPQPVEGQPLQNVQIGTVLDGNPAGVVGDFSVTAEWGDGEVSRTSDGNVSLVADPSQAGLFKIMASKPNPYAEEASALTFRITVNDVGGAS